jgi:hypothetical protein
LAHLCVNALAVCGHSRVAVFHAFFMRLIYAAEKPRLFSALILLR